MFRFGKTLGKEFVSKQEYDEPMFKNKRLDKDVLNLVIAEHMFRSGNYAAGEMFCKEASVQMTD